MSIHYTTCNICEATCGLAVHVDGHRVTHIEPDTEHVASHGYACVKGLKIHEVHHSPDRLRYPMKRVGERFIRVSWEQALHEIGQKAKQLRREHGADSLSVYLGNPISFNFLSPVLAAGFAQGLGTKNFFQTGSQDCNNKFVVAQRMYGFPFVQPYPDVDRTQLLICVGSNPAVSRMSFIHLPDPVRRLRAIEKRGGKVVFVNPRRTESARQLGEHVFIRPDTDVFFYLSFLHEVLRHGVDRAFERIEHVRSAVGVDHRERARVVVAADFAGTHGFRPVWRDAASPRPARRARARARAASGRSASRGGCRGPPPASVRDGRPRSLR